MEMRHKLMRHLRWHLNEYIGILFIPFILFMYTWNHFWQQTDEIILSFCRAFATVVVAYYVFAAVNVIFLVGVIPIYGYARLFTYLSGKLEVEQNNLEELVFLPCCFGFGASCLFGIEVGKLAIIFFDLPFKWLGFPDATWCGFFL